MEEGGPSRGPIIVGVVAIVAGLVLVRVAGSDGPARPHVLGEVITAGSTTTTPLAEVASSPTTAAPTTRASGTTPTTLPATTTSTSSPGATTTSSAEPTSTSSSTPTTEPCPSGAPVVEMRTWDGSGGESGWHLRVSGAVSNRTGAAVDLGAVYVTFTRADGSEWDVPADTWPVPDPSHLDDRADATWSWEGDGPAGDPFTGVVASLVSWRWGDAPAGCASAGAAP